MISNTTGAHIDQNIVNPAKYYGTGVLDVQNIVIQLNIEHKEPSNYSRKSVFLIKKSEVELQRSSFS